MSPRWGSTPRQTDRLTVGRNSFTHSQKPIKAVILQVPFTSLAEDISDGLVDLGFDVISVKQMPATRR
jgi:hypothetical protein